MANSYKKLSALDLLESPSTSATVVIIDGGREWRAPLSALVPIDRAITSAAQLPAAAVGDVKWFINASRDTLECHEYRAPGKWHQIL